MKMYDELIKNLRNCSEINSLSRYKRDLMKQAADAIEDLQDKFKTLMDKYIRLAAHTEWIPVTKRLPNDGEYLVAYTLNTIPPKKKMCVCYFAKNLYKVDEYNFQDKKRKPGFFSYDSEYGFFERTDITHWTPLPEPPESEGE